MNALTPTHVFATVALAVALIPVDSNLLQAYGYDVESRTLAIQFPDRATKPGDVYHYYDFPADEWEKFQAAESKSKFFQAHIRGGKYRYQKLPDAEGIVHGLSQAQEPKYTTVDKDGRIVNRATGKPIPDSEPIFVLRAQDQNAAETIRYYMSLCQDSEQIESVSMRLDAFESFKANHPEQMKEPETAAA